MSKVDGIHENFFAIPELPHKKKEQEAILILQKLVTAYKKIKYQEDKDDFYHAMRHFMYNKEFVDWIMKYKQI
jgi:hypothetical protein